MTPYENETIETLFGYAQTIASALFRTIARKRLTNDDRRTIVYYCEPIIEKIKAP